MDDAAVAVDGDTTGPELLVLLRVRLRLRVEVRMSVKVRICLGESVMAGPKMGKGCGSSVFGNSNDVITHMRENGKQKTPIIMPLWTHT